MRLSRAIVAACGLLGSAAQAQSVTLLGSGTAAYGVSADGTTLVGLASDGLSNQAFVVTIPAPGPLAMTAVGLVLVPRRRR